MLMTLLIVLLVLSLGGGGWGSSRYGVMSWSPLGVIVVIALVLYMTGNLSMH